MGDRTYMEVICRAEDQGVFEDLGFGEQEYWEELPEGVSFLVDEQANYGHSSDLKELAEKGYVFIGHHDVGGDTMQHGSSRMERRFTRLMRWLTKRGHAWRSTPMEPSTRCTCCQQGSTGAPSRVPGRSWALRWGRGRRDRT